MRREGVARGTIWQTVNRGMRSKGWVTGDRISFILSSSSATAASVILELLHFDR